MDSFNIIERSRFLRSIVRHRKFIHIFHWNYVVYRLSRAIKDVNDRDYHYYSIKANLSNISNRYNCSNQQTNDRKCRMCIWLPLFDCNSSIWFSSSRIISFTRVEIKSVIHTNTIKSPKELADSNLDANRQKDYGFVCLRQLTYFPPLCFSCFVVYPTALTLYSLLLLLFFWSTMKKENNKKCRKKIFGFVVVVHWQMVEKHKYKSKILFRLMSM